MSFLRKTIAASAAVLTLSAPVAAAEDVPMSGIGNYSLQASQYYPFGLPYPWDTPGSPYRQMKECADGVSRQLYGSARGSSLGDGDAYMLASTIAPVGCVLSNPMLNGALDRQMRDVAKR